MNEEITAKEVFERSNYNFLAKHLPPIVLHVVPRFMQPQGKNMQTGTEGTGVALHKMETAEMTATSFYALISSLIGESKILKRNIAARPTILLVDVASHTKTLSRTKPFDRVAIRMEDTQHAPIHASVSLSREELAEIEKKVVYNGRKSEALLKRQLAAGEYNAKFRDAIITAYADRVASELWRIAREKSQRRATG